MTSRGKTTPDSTNGSFSPATGRTSRVELAGEQPANTNIDADAIADRYRAAGRLHGIDDLKRDVTDFSTQRNAWHAQHPGWTIIGCDGGNFDTPVSITVSDPNGLTYEITRDDVDELVVEHNYEYVNEPPVELTDDDNGIGDAYNSIAHIGRMYGYPAVDAINPAIQEPR